MPTDALRFEAMQRSRANGKAISAFIVAKFARPRIG
jgi:hypothetical protein